MAIDGGLRDKLAPGTRLVARYKGADYEVEVVTGEEGKTRYRFADGQEFKSPSAAGSAVMGGIACNGWRFWSLEGETAAPAAKPSPKRAQAAAQTAQAAAGKARPRCARCGKQFVGVRQLAHHEANADRLCIAA